MNQSHTFRAHIGNQSRNKNSNCYYSKHDRFEECSRRTTFVASSVHSFRISSSLWKSSIACGDRRWAIIAFRIFLVTRLAFVLVATRRGFGCRVAGRGRAVQNFRIPKEKAFYFFLEYFTAASRFHLPSAFFQRWTVTRVTKRQTTMTATQLQII